MPLLEVCNFPKSWRNTLEDAHTELAARTAPTAPVLQGLLDKVRVLDNSLQNITVVELPETWREILADAAVALRRQPADQLLSLIEAAPPAMEEDEDCENGETEGDADRQ